MVTDAALVVRPNMDSPENGGAEGPMAYGELWMGWVLSSLAWRGSTRKQLYGGDAVGDKFDGANKSMDPSLVVGVGHGGPDIWVGQYINGGYSTLLTTANSNMMAGRVVYLLSCLTAQMLGPDMVNKGAVAYGGYNQEFVWAVESPESPATDRLAAPFGKASTMFPRALVTKTVGVSKEKTIEVFNQEIEWWEKNEDPYAREVVKWLLWDRDAFTVIGDEEARGLEPKLAIGLVLSAVGACIVGYWILRRR